MTNEEIEADEFAAEHYEEQLWEQQQEEQTWDK
jgi:hypothetical protein